MSVTEKKRVTGEVIEYNALEERGFVQTKDGDEYFFENTEEEMIEHLQLHTGDTVTFVIQPNSEKATQITK